MLVLTEIYAWDAPDVTGIGVFNEPVNTWDADIQYSYN